ncbi:MAG TPA: hypothetical protein VMS55_26440 [Myxococcota bacterium]|nr:hypothetical protein [Myxococcota bacterium]
MRFTVLFELGRNPRRPLGGSSPTARELIQGYWMVEAPSPAEVIEWAGTAVEIRRVIEVDDVRIAG